MIKMLEPICEWERIEIWTSRITNAVKRGQAFASLNLHGRYDLRAPSIQQLPRFTITVEV